MKHDFNPTSRAVTSGWTFEKHRITALVCLALLACTSQSPFSRPPSAVAVDEPCRFMGTVHKESRQRLEVLRACEAISMAEWSCMTDALKDVDVEFTAVCRSRPVLYPEIASRQRSLYLACASGANAETVECALLSADARCLAIGCEQSGPLVREPEDRPWDLRQFIIEDCNGYLTSFAAEIPDA